MINFEPMTIFLSYDLTTLLEYSYLFLARVALEFLSKVAVLVSKVKAILFFIEEPDPIFSVIQVLTLLLLLIEPEG